MAIQNLASADLRPARLNAAGRCVHCLGLECTSARCIDNHARAVWEVCERCGGTEYVNGHVDPATAMGRCDCIGGLVEAARSGLAQVVDLPVPPAAVVYESWPATGGAPVRWMSR